MPRIRVRVVCGLSETMAIFVPMMRLRRVDLPALGRPTMETKPARTSAAWLPRVHFDGLRFLNADLVDAAAFGLENLHAHAVELESLAHCGHAADPRQDVAADRLEPHGLDSTPRRSRTSSKLTLR